MALESDAQGFLIGKSLSGDADGSLKAIKSDTGKILAVMLKAGGYRATARAVAPAGRSAMPARDAAGRFVATPMRGGSAGLLRGGAGGGGSVAAAAARAQRTDAVALQRVDQVAKAVGQLAATEEARRQSDKADDRASVRANRQARSADGRFGSGARSRMGGIGGAAFAVGSAAADADRVDPIIEAMGEARNGAGRVAQVASPLGRTLRGMLARGSEEEKQTGFMRKQWIELKRLRKDGSDSARAVLRRMGMNSKNGGAASSGSLGLLGMLGSAIPGLLSGGAGLLGGAAGAAGGLAGLLMRGGKGVLSSGAGLLKGVGKRIPLIGNLISMISGYGDDQAIAGDASLTEEQKRAGRIKNGAGVAGGLIGTTIGGIVGSIAGPVGTVLGATVGGWLGNEGGKLLAEPLTNLYDWFKDLRIGEKVSETFDAGMKVFTDVGAWLQSLPGFKDLKNGVDNVVESVQEGATTAVQAVRSGAGAALEAGRGAASWAGDKLRTGMGAVSSFFESGGKGAGTVSTGAGDFGGASYGTHQLSSKAGTLQKFLAGSPYGAQFAGMQPGSPEFNAKWKALAATDPGFGDAQKGFIKATHYEPQMAHLKASGIDLSGSSDAVKEAVYSTSVQFGGKTDLIKRAFAGRDVASMSDADKIRAIQDYKTANNDTLFRSSSPAVRAGTLRRAGDEKAMLLAMNAAAPDLKAIPPVAVPAAPAMDMGPTQLNTPAPAAPAPAPVMASQDVPDRTIAHIVTGGIGGGWNRR